jgi:hypothetical protein
MATCETEALITVLGPPLPIALTHQLAFGGSRRLGP